MGTLVAVGVTVVVDIPVAVGILATDCILLTVRVRECTLGGGCQWVNFQ